MSRAAGCVWRLTEVSSPRPCKLMLDKPSKYVASTTNPIEKKTEVVEGMVMQHEQQQLLQRTGVTCHETFSSGLERLHLNHN